MSVICNSLRFFWPNVILKVYLESLHFWVKCRPESSPIEALHFWAKCRPKKLTLSLFIFGLNVVLKAPHESFRFLSQMSSWKLPMKLYNFRPKCRPKCWPGIFKILSQKCRPKKRTLRFFLIFGVKCRLKLKRRKRSWPWVCLVVILSDISLRQEADS